MTKKTNWSQFGTLITVFFFWGFVAASNDILIPVFKKAFTLTQVQSQLVAMAFYVAYTVGSIIYIAISKAIGGDLLNKTGYKNGIAIGLVISAIGTLLFYPAANNASFTLMLTALFIVALGFSLQQIAANPLAIVIGDPQTGSQRLSMAGGVNNFGTTIGPLLVSFAIFGSVSAGNTEASITAVKTPYLILGLAFILVAVFFKFSSIPNRIDTEPEPALDIEESPTFTADSIVRNTPTHSGALQYPQLVLGMIGIFIYVGVEVSTASNLPEFLRQHLEVLNGHYVMKSLHLAGAKEFTNDLNAPFISLYWASLMMGRWCNSADAFDVSAGTKKILSFIMPYIAFIIYLVVNSIAKHDVSTFYIYSVLILIMIAGNVLSKGNPATMLLIFSGLGIVALVIGMLTNGLVSVFAFVSVGLFCSTLWPCVFTLGVAGLGRFTNQGSSYLIMMIMGGGFIAALQGYLASDKLLGIQYSYIVGVVCFAYLAFFAIRAKTILRSQGIDYDKPVAAGH